MMKSTRGLWNVVAALALTGGLLGGCNNEAPKPAPTPASPMSSPATATSTAPSVNDLPSTRASTQADADAAAIPFGSGERDVLPAAAQQRLRNALDAAADANGVPSTLPATAPTTKVTASPPGAGALALAAKPQVPEGPATKPVVDATKIPQNARVPGWYQWRGPEQNGVSRERNLPDTWDPETKENLVWTSDVGAMSSPVIWNGKLYTYSRVGEEPAGNADQPTVVPGHKTQEALVCVDIANGKVLWKAPKNMTQTEVPFHRLGWSSPAVDPSTGRVYGMGSQATLECVDGDSGTVIWDRQMTEEFGTISTFGGRTPAPTIDEDQVFLAGVSFGWGDHARSQHRIFAFNKHTGELNWSAGTGGIPVDAPQNTPVIAVVKGQRLVIFAAGDGGIHAFQARTGKRVWAHKASKRGINTSVVIDGERLYCSHGLDNYDTNHLGRVFCLDIGNLDEKGNPKELWHISGIEAAFPTNIVAGKWLYTIDDRARLYQIDKETGKVAWKRAVGTVGKPSPVFADGKLYITEGNGRFSIIRPADKLADVKVLSRTDLPEKLGREYAIYGSPAIADGRVYLQTATKIFCIARKDAKPESDPIPPMPDEAAATDQVAQLQVHPYDVALHAGASTTFKARGFDANGRFVAEVPADQVKWAIGQVTIPAPPVRRPTPDYGAPTTGPTAANVPAVTQPAALPAGGGGAAVKAESSDDARAQLAVVAATQPTTGPASGATKAGNLLGEVDATGTFKSKAGPHQGGAIDATYQGVTGGARVRVFPPPPWKFDFQAAPVGKPPLTWLGAGGKYAVVEDPDDKANKVLQKLFEIDLYWRARTNFGMVDQADYTVQADAKVHEKITAERRTVPTAGIINSRYVLVMEGMAQTLQIHVWPSALPESINATMPFPFEAKRWYTMKLEVTQQGDKAIARGKCWPAGTPEPAEWMLKLEDPIPNRQGNPGLFSVSLVGQFKSEVYYDNILVTPNPPATAAAAANENANK